jgi:hypothetical protein
MATFNSAEIESIVGTPLGLINLNPLFIDDAREPFHSFCGILTRGKEMSNPNIKRKRDALLLMFDDFSQNKKLSPKMSKNQKLSYLELTDGFRRLGKRWTFYSPDELLTLAVLMDLENKGYFTFEDFFNFAFIVTESWKQGKADPTKCFDVLFECLRERLLRRMEETRRNNDYRIAPALEEKLVDIVANARRRGMAPLMVILSYVGEYGTDLSADLLSDLFRQFGVIVEETLRAEVRGDRNVDHGRNREDAAIHDRVDGDGQQRMGTEFDGTPAEETERVETESDGITDRNEHVQSPTKQMGANMKVENTRMIQLRTALCGVLHRFSTSLF